MRLLSTATLKLGFVLLMAGGTLLTTGQRANAVSCSTKGCIPAYIQCTTRCESLPAGEQAACRSACEVAEENCFDICS
jgi:hypothetical protein